MIFERIVRRILGRGRRRRFGVTPTVRNLRKLQERYPIQMNGVWYGSLFTGAEFSQQIIKHYYNTLSTPPGSSSTPVSMKNSSNTDHKQVLKYDFTSVKRMAVWGTVVIAPLFTQWYKWLDGKKSFSIWTKIFFDQGLLTPPLLIAFFGVMAACEFKRYSWSDSNELWNHVKQEIVTKLPKVYLADCLFWIPVQLLNFKYVPPTWRVLYVAVTTFLWTNVLCFARSYKTLNK